MGIFTPDFSSVESSIPVFDKMRALVKVTGVKPFFNEKADGNGKVKQNAGLQYNLELVAERDPATGNLITEDRKGRTVSSYKVYTHTEGGWRYAKPFLMAAMGFNPRKQEQEANVEFQKKDWKFAGEPNAAPETFDLGTGWQIPVDQTLEVTLTKKVDKVEGKDDFESQEFSGWMPLNG